MLVECLNYGLSWELAFDMDENDVLPKTLPVKVISDNVALVRENFNGNVKYLTHVNTESERNIMIKILIEFFSVLKVCRNSAIVFCFS